MANVIVDDSTLRAIGDAIRTKGKTDRTLLPSEMPDAIRDMRIMANAELIGYVEKTINLADDTTFDSITPNNSSAQTIRAAQTNELEMEFEAVDLDAYDILTFTRTDFVPVYKQGNILPRLIKQSSFNIARGCRYFRPNSNPVTAESAIKSAYLTTPDNTTGSYLYLGTNGAAAWTASLSNNSIIAVSSRPTVWTSGTPSGGAANSQGSRFALGIKWSPAAVTVRGSTISFSAAAMMDLDSKACEIVRSIYAYRIPIKDRTLEQEIIQRAYMFDFVPELQETLWR